MRFIILILLIFITNCKFNKVVDSHGVHFLDKKQQKLSINTSNKNDILNLLGPPSTKSTFNNDLWIYIERKKTSSNIKNLGRKKTYINNVLLLEIDNKGLLVKKNFLDMKDMKKIKFSEGSTKNAYAKKSFVYDFLSSMRQKINDPLGVRKKEREKKRKRIFN